MTRNPIQALRGTAILLLATSACSSELPTEDSTHPVVAIRSNSENDRSALLSKIGRGLALALAEPAVRAWIRSQIDASPYVEWRIPFRDLLLHQQPAPAMRRVSALIQLSSDERVRQKALPPLELYFPIPQHRIGWQAHSPVQVAVRNSLDGSYSVYSMDGAVSVIRGNHVPATATLVLAPSEIDYSHLPSAIRGGVHTGPGMLVQAKTLQASVMAAALPPAEETPPPPPPTGGVTTSRHTRLGAFRTTRYHDDWLGGNDEVEIYGSVRGGYKECAWRTDVGPNRDYFLDLASVSSTIATAVPWGTELIYVEAFEDDDARCVRRSSDDRYGSTFLDIGDYELMVGTSNPGHIAVRLHSKLP